MIDIAKLSASDVGRKVVLAEPCHICTEDALSDVVCSQCGEPTCAACLHNVTFHLPNDEPDPQRPGEYRVCIRCLDGESI